MKTLLDTGSTWFLESFTQGPYSRLVIRLAEGETSDTPASVSVAEGASIGPAYAVTVARECRVVEIIFSDPLAFFTRREEFDSMDPGFEFEKENAFIRLVTRSSLQDFAREATGVYSTGREGICEYHIWTEDQIFQVFSCEPPEVLLTPDSPDPTILRGKTWVRRDAR
jgi:hypothetical protein